MRIVAIDPSTKNTGVSTFDNGELVDWHLFSHDKVKDTEERIDLMGADLIRYLNKQSPDAVYIEHPQGYGRNVSVVGMLCELLGIVRCYTICKGIEYHEFTPSVWRKYVPDFEQGGKKRDELKKLSIKYVKDKFGIDVTDDVSDSILIGIASVNYWNRKGR